MWWSSWVRTFSCSNLPLYIYVYRHCTSQIVETNMTDNGFFDQCRHVFKGEGYNNPTDERHCVNSVSLKFEDGDPDATSQSA